jgi:protein arginine N-methyltransferase 1
VDGVVLDISGDDIEVGKTSDSWKHCYLPIDAARGSGTSS